MLSHIDDWILSKNFTQQEIDAMIGSLSFSNFASEEIQDMNSAVSRKLMQALEKENLVKGWRPAKGARIALIHHKKDITVPYVNQTNLYNYFVKMTLRKPPVETSHGWTICRHTKTALSTLP